jgi:mycobactin peptide synthetase MbtE
MNAKRQLVERIRSHVDGNAIAIAHGEHRITYSALHALLDLRISVLRGHGAAGRLVAVERRKSADFVVDFLSVLAVGGTVVPLDPDTPADRRATFLELTRPELLLRNGVPLPLGGDGSLGIPDDGAFVYFTSGSTGIPKPVLGSAAAQRSFLEWFCPEFGIGEADRFAFLTGVSFEASLRDILPPLYAGATLVVPDSAGGDAPEATVAWLAGNDISVVTAVPSVARTWLRSARAPAPSVRAVFFVGEPLTADVLTGWPALFPNTAVRVNSYGSTEGGQATIYHRLQGRPPARVPAGRPVPGTRYCLIDPAAPLRPDVVRASLAEPATGGEIVVVSRSCSHGYLGMPAENAARFADLGGGLTAYRTGDLGQVDDRGDLCVLGRVDDQVKINGVRVHPAEVTRALRAHPAVDDAFVTAAASATDSADARLTAYVVPSRELSPLDLRRDLLDRLPPAMVPARFVRLPELPRARTGKVDRDALVRLAEHQPATDAFVPPSGDLECWLAEQVAALLDRDRVSASDDLFALGGDSITAARLAARLSGEFGVDLSLRSIFAAGTVAGVADAVVEHQLLAADPDEARALLDAVGGGAPDELRRESA